MYDEEPRAICNLPLSGTVGIISSLVLLSQVLALFLVCSSNFFIYLFELLVAFGMVFFLSQGVRHQKPGHLAVYMAYLAIYVFMMMFIIFGLVIGLSFLPSYKRYCNELSSTTKASLSSIQPEKPNQHIGLLFSMRSTKAAHPMAITRNPPRSEEKVLLGDYSAVSEDVQCVQITGAFWANIWSSLTLCFISIAISCIQIHYTLILYKYLRCRQREHLSQMNVSYQHFVPGAPPRYTPESPYTVQTSPALVEANSLPIKTSCPTIITSLKADSLIPSTSLEKNGLSVPFMNMEKAPEYTETPGPSESTFPVVSLERTESRMDEVDLSESKSNQPNLLK